MKVTFQKVIKNLPEKKLYTLAVGTVIGLIFFNQLLIQYVLNQQWYDAKTIGMAGRQQVLCQQIVGMLSEEDVSPVERERLLELTTQWDLVHQGLQNGSDDLKIDKLASEKVQSLFAKINPDQFRILDQATGKMKLGTVEELQTSSSNFINTMDEIVTMCEAHSQSKLFAIIMLELGLAVMTLLILLFEIKYIFKPVFAKITKQQMLLKREIENLRSTKELLQAIQNSTSVCTIVVNRELKIISFNNQAKKLFHFAGKDSIKMGESIQRYIAVHMQEGFAKNLNLALNGEEVREEYIMVDHQAKTGWFDILFHPMQDEKGHVDGVAFSSIDITKSKEYELELLEQNEKLKEIAFIHAHELRGPITSMQGLIDLMVQDKNGERDCFDQQYGEPFRHLSGKVDKIIRTIVDKSSAFHGKQL